MLLGPNYTDQDYINLYVEQLRLLKRLQQQFQYEVNICAVQGLSDRITKIVLTPLGTATEFALVPLLNGSDKELVISQTIPRGRTHWVVNFSPEPKVIFESADFELDRKVHRYTRYMTCLLNL